MAKKLIVLIVVAAVAVAGFGGWYLFIRDDAPDALVIADSTTGSGKGIDAATLDGAWTVAPGTGSEETVAGYRVKEEFAGARKVEAAGRTSDVTGTLTVAGGSVTEATFTVNTQTLASDEGRRDSAIKTRGLQTDTFPEATFAITEPITLPKITDGTVFKVSAKGALTLHGVTKPTTIELSGRATDGGKTFVIQGSAPIVMADFDIEPPSIGGFVTVRDNGSLEFIVNFKQG